ncbi:MAG TPA: hypothetical protein VGC16_06425 [Rhizomicrobium sp.]
MERIISNDEFPNININIPPRQKDARRTAGGVFAAWESRTELVKQQARAESAASDAKTARLKALRLEKEALDAETARIAAENAPPAPPKKPRVKRTVS